MTRTSGQKARDEYDPLNAHEAEVFLPYEAVVDRLEDAAKQLPGATLLHRDGLAILRVGTASASHASHRRPEIWLQGGLHACEWIGPVVVLRLMDELIRSSELRGCATWYLLPVVDAHGYQRTWAGERFLRTTENGLSRLRAPLALSLVPLEEAQPAPFGAQGSFRDRRGSREPTRGTLRIPSPSRCIHGGPDGRELSRLCVS